MISGFIATNQYFNNEQILQLFFHSNTLDKIDIVISMLKKYLTFLKGFDQLGSMAQQNIKQKKMQEIYDEMQKIAKYQTQYMNPKKSESVMDKLKQKMEDNIDVKNVNHLEYQSKFNEELKKYS